MRIGLYIVKYLQFILQTSQILFIFCASSLICRELSEFQSISLIMHIHFWNSLLEVSIYKL